MYRRVLKFGCIVMLPFAAGLGGCAQMTRHSNTLVFGTDTTLGVKLGQSASQAPAVEIGYNRQELAFVPVLANTEGDANLDPCPVASIKDCHFRASSGGADKDSYSTIASFGGKAKANGTNTDGNVTVAQYFATGIAAQKLALTGGANIVQAGGNTEAKANAAANVAKAQERINAANVASSVEKGKIVAKTILGSGDDVVVDSKRDELAAKMGTGCDLAAKSDETVTDYIERLQNSRPTCLNRLGIDVSE